MAKIISGKEVSAAVREQIRKECDELKAKGIILEDTPQGVKWRRA